jgi:hypothetical protein
MTASPNAPKRDRKPKSQDSGQRPVIAAGLTARKGRDGLGQIERRRQLAVGDAVLPIALDRVDEPARSSLKVPPVEWTDEHRPGKEAMLSASESFAPPACDRPRPARKAVVTRHNAIVAPPEKGFRKPPFLGGIFDRPVGDPWTPSFSERRYRTVTLCHAWRPRGGQSTPEALAELYDATGGDHDARSALIET